MEHKMKPLIIVLALTMATTAMAQDSIFSIVPTARMQDLPKTIPYNDAKGNQIGTATIWQNKMYIRDLKGELIGTIVEEDGKRTLYDPHGKILDQLTGTK